MKNYKFKKSYVIYKDNKKSIHWVEKTIKKNYIIKIVFFNKYNYNNKW